MTKTKADQYRSVVDEQESMRLWSLACEARERFHAESVKAVKLKLARQKVAYSVDAVNKAPWLFGFRECAKRPGMIVVFVRSRPADNEALHLPSRTANQLKARRMQ